MSPLTFLQSWHPARLLLTLEGQQLQLLRLVHMFCQAKQQLAHSTIGFGHWLDPSWQDHIPHHTCSLFSRKRSAQHASVCTRPIFETVDANVCVRSPSLCHATILPSLVFWILITLFNLDWWGVKQAPNRSLATKIQMSCIPSTLIYVGAGKMCSSRVCTFQLAPTGDGEQMYLWAHFVPHQEWSCCKKYVERTLSKEISIVFPKTLQNRATESKADHILPSLVSLWKRCVSIKALQFPKQWWLWRVSYGNKVCTGHQSRKKLVFSSHNLRARCPCCLWALRQIMACVEVLMWRARNSKKWESKAGKPSVSKTCFAIVLMFNTWFGAM